MFTFLNDPLAALLWICVFLFLLTGLITLLGIAQILKIPRQYLKPLFWALDIRVSRRIDHCGYRQIKRWRRTICIK